MHMGAACYDMLHCTRLGEPNQPTRSKVLTATRGDSVVEQMHAYWHVMKSSGIHTPKVTRQ